MTIATETSEVEYVGNGVTTEWDFDFPVHKKSDLDLYLYSIAAETEQLISSGSWDFALTDELESTGYVTYPLTGSPVGSTHKVILRRNVPITQEMDAANQRALKPESIEFQMDRTVMQVGDVKRLAALARTEVSDLGLRIAALELGADPLVTTYAGFLANFYVYNPCEPRFGAEGDGVVDDTIAVQAAYAAAIVAGKGIVLINHPHKITGEILCTVGRIMTYSPGPQIGYFLCFGAGTGLRYSIASIEESGAPSVDGLGLYRSDGDKTSTALVFESAALLGDGEGEVSGAEKGPIISRCRIDSESESPKNITGATSADPVVITIEDHGYVTDDVLRIVKMEGMTELNDREVDITVINDDTFSINAEDGAAYPTYTGGGTAQRKASGYWKNGIVTKHLSHTHIDKCWIKGLGGKTTSKTGAGISLGHFCNGTQIYNNAIRGFFGGIHVDDTVFFDVDERANNTAYAVGDIIKTSANPRYRFVCITAGTSLATFPTELSTLYEAVRNRGEVIDGTATFVAAGFQAEGISVRQNKLQACDRGVYSTITSVENTWAIEDNDFDCGHASTWIRNGLNVTITGNSSGWNNPRKDQVDFYFERTDGANADDPYKVVANVKDNLAYRGGNLTLIVTGITRGATTTLTYTKDEDKPHPALGDVLFLASVEGTVELNNVPFRAGTVTATNDTSGTVILLDYVTSTNVNSTNFGAHSGNARVNRYGRFVELGTARNVHVHDNIIGSRNVGMHLSGLTQDCSYYDNSETTLIDRPVYNLSTGYGTNTIRGLNDNFYDDGGAVGDGVADDTANLQAVLTAGRSLRLNPLKTYLLTTSLIIAAANTGVDGNGALIKMSTKTGHFDNATYSSRYGTDAVGIRADDLAGVFVRRTKIKLSTWVDELYLKAIYYEGCTNTETLNNEIYDFSRGKGVVSYNDCGTQSGNNRVPAGTFTHNFIHDVYTVASAGTAPQRQVTGLDVDADASVGTVGLKISYNSFCNISAAYASLGGTNEGNLEADGIQFAGEQSNNKPTRFCEVTHNFFSNTGEAIDCFGDDNTISHNFFHRIFEACVALKNGASRNKVLFNTASECGLSIVYISGNSNTVSGVQQNADGNEIRGNISTGQAPTGDWYATGSTKLWDATAAGRAAWGATTTHGVYCDLGGDGRTSVISNTIIEDNAFDGATRASYGVRFSNNTGGSRTNRVRNNRFSNFATGTWTDIQGYFIFERGRPKTETADFTVGEFDDVFIVNKGSSCAVTLPSAASFPGRVISLTTIQAFTVVSASSNVVPRTGGAAGTAIVAATDGGWAELVSDGSNWIALRGNT